MDDDGFDGPKLRNVALDTTPLYIQLRDLMIDRIRSKAWRSGQTLPNELNLSNEFRVSVGTVRKAMQDLDDRGLVTRQQGRGTVVNDQVVSAAASFLDRIRRPDGSAFTWDAPRTSVRLAKAELREETVFGPLSDTAQVLHFEWILSADGQRRVLQDTAVPHELVELDIDQVRHVDSLDELFDRARIFLDRTDCALSVAPADDRVADILKVPSGTALQRMKRRLYDLRGRTIAISEDWLALAGGYYTHVQRRASE